MEYLAAETKERYLGPGESEKFIGRRMQKWKTVLEAEELWKTG